MRIPWRRSILTRPGRRRLRPALPTATACLLTASLAGLGGWYALRWLNEGAEADLLRWAGLTADGLFEGRLWEPFTCLFLPGGVSWLLLVQLPLLLLAGRHLEAIVGRRHVVTLFLMAGAAGGLAQVVVNHVHGAADAPVAGPGAGVLAVFVALACAVPETDLVPPWSLSAGTGNGWLRIKHGALASVLLASVVVVAGEAGGLWPGGGGPGVAGAARGLAACVVACVYMRQLGFGRRAPSSPEQEAAWAAAALHEDEGFEEPVFAGPVAAAAGRLVVPRFTEVERRMSARQYISACIDPILDKISRHGIGSLTDEERHTLSKAREKMSARGK